MRIIAGTKKGMKLLPPKGRDTRPITDRVKESLFSILYTKGMLEDVVVADLFCGTGSMGLEALSRGAKFCTFIDGSRQVTGILDRNIEKARFLAESKTVCANILKVGAAPTPEYGCYDLIFCASRMGVTDIRTTDYLVIGASPAMDTLDAANNRSEIALVSGMGPGMEDAITITIDKGATSTSEYGFYYLGTLEIRKSSPD